MCFYKEVKLTLVGSRSDVHKLQIPEIQIPLGGVIESFDGMKSKSIDMDDLLSGRWDARSKKGFIRWKYMIWGSQLSMIEIIFDDEEDFVLNQIINSIPNSHNWIYRTEKTCGCSGGLIKESYFNKCQVTLDLNGHVGNEFCNQILDYETFRMRIGKYIKEEVSLIYCSDISD
jgi:hypothetical protein